MKMYIPETKVIKKNFKTSGAWFSGFFEGDGCVHLCDQTYQISFIVGQKDLHILEQIEKLYGGSINYNASWDGYSWKTTNKADLINLFEYFAHFQLKSKKNEDILLGQEFFKYKLLGHHLDSSKQSKLQQFIKKFKENRK